MTAQRFALPTGAALPWRERSGVQAPTSEPAQTLAAGIFGKNREKPALPEKRVSKTPFLEHFLLGEDTSLSYEAENPTGTFSTISWNGGMYQLEPLSSATGFYKPHGAWAPAPGARYPAPPPAVSQDRFF